MMKEETIDIGTVGDDLLRAYEQGLEDGKPKWIPVSERLPEEKENVLCICRGNLVRILYFSGEVWVGFGAYIKSFVTHWMPILEPPKEETDG